jgi:DNA-directed RNA polymerase subunit omega
MARVTVEDCLRNMPNRFALVLLATKRTRQLLDGSAPLVSAKNKLHIIALREIAAGRVRYRAEGDDAED